MVTVRYPKAIVWAIAALWGLQFAFLNPALALLLVSLYGASTGQVAVVLLIYNAACLVTAWLIPRWADRRGNYVLPMVGCAVFTVALSVVLILTDVLPIAIAGLVMLGAPAAVGMPLLFGYVRHAGATPSEVVRTRAVFSMAWVVGPPAAAVIISAAGGDALVWAIAAVGMCTIATTSVLSVRGRTALAGPDDEPAPVTAELPSRSVARSAIALLVVGVALLQAANTTSVSVTTLFVTDGLGLSPIWGGVALGVAAALEVPVLFFIGRANRRFRDLTLLSLACVLAAAYYVVMTLAQTGGVVIAAQVVNASFYAILSGIGLTYFQSLIAGPGVAAGAFSNSLRLGSLLAGPLIGMGAVLGDSLRAVFLLCAVLSLVSLGALRLAARR